MSRISVYEKFQVTHYDPFILFFGKISLEIIDTEKTYFEIIKDENIFFY